jgi:uncharacterized protein YndB with AHSA1/START domain
MKGKTNFELEYVLETSPKVLNNVLFTPDGLSDWFCNDVNIKEDIYAFDWDGYIEEARLLSTKQGQHIKWQWIEDEDDGHETCFGFSYQTDPLTKAVILKVYGSSDVGEEAEAKALWEQHVNDLRRLIGA